MSSVEEIRKLMQDFLAPELRELKAELNNVHEELPQMERRLLDAIRASEEKLSPKIENAELRAKMSVLEDKLQKQLFAQPR